jgi:hypothetical protein
MPEGVKGLKETVGFLYYNVYLFIGKVGENQETARFVLQPSGFKQQPFVYVRIILQKHACEINC